MLPVDSETYNCPSCGKPVAMDAVHCKHCGEQLAINVTEQARQKLKRMAWWLWGGLSVYCITLRLMKLKSASQAEAGWVTLAGMVYFIGFCLAIRLRARAGQLVRADVMECVSFHPAFLLFPGVLALLVLFT
ncbi:MAG TPA: zinc ribbon domain-containing protein [Verrucomicrobiae bacterium]|nr:zinc ribbon domain-containing protein [Verrucomicrobiae bacterium]